MPNVGGTPPAPQSPIADPATGIVTIPWWYWFQTLLTRTGGLPGVDVTTVQTLAQTAETQAEAAQTAAAAALTAANTAQTTANAAETAALAATATADGASTTATAAAATATAAQTTAATAQTAVAAETTRALAAEALLAPKASPTFTGLAPKFALFIQAVNDAAAAAAGVVVGQFYVNGSVLMQRQV